MDTPKVYIQNNPFQKNSVKIALKKKTPLYKLVVKDEKDFKITHK